MTPPQLRCSVKHDWLLSFWFVFCLTDFAKCSHCCDCFNIQLPVLYWEDATCTYHERVCQSYWSNTYVSVNKSKPTESLEMKWMRKNRISIHCLTFVLNVIISYEKHMFPKNNPFQFLHPRAKLSLLSFWTCYYSSHLASTSHVSLTTDSDKCSL